MELSLVIKRHEVGVHVMTQTDVHTILSGKTRFLKICSVRFPFIKKHTPRVVRNAIYQTVNSSHCWIKLEKRGIYTLNSSVMFECVMSVYSLSIFLKI